MQGGLELADGPLDWALYTAGYEMSFSVCFGLLVSLQPGPKQAINTAEIKAQGCLWVTPVNYTTTGGHLRILLKKKTI